jgi:hypothetical protein
MSASALVFSHGATSLRATSGIELRRDHQTLVLVPDFPPAPPAVAATVAGLGPGQGTEVSVAIDGGRVTRWVHKSADGTRLAVRLGVTNDSDQALSLVRFSPLRVDGDGLRLGDVPAADWILLRQPRHKNDMPASLPLGGTGSAVRDGVRGSAETGGWPAGAADPLPERYVSAELTVLRTATASLVLAVLPLDCQLVRTTVALTADRQALQRLQVDCEGDGQRLRPGQTLLSQWVVADLDPDPMAAISRYVAALQALGGRRPPGQVRPCPTVWCSWYYYGNGMTQAEAEANLAALDDRPVPFDVFQIDECWDYRWGDWQPNPDWPDLAGLVQRIRQRGRIAGLWTCVFLAEPRSRLAGRHPDWLLRRRDGGHVRFDMGGMPNYVLDPTHPEVQQFVADLYRHLTEELGFAYHKVDFTRAVAMDPEAAFHDPTCSRAQAYRAGIAAIRRGIGPAAYLNICGGLYGPPLGLVDSQRSGADVKSEWPAAPPGEGDGGYGPFTIKQNTLRWWWNELWDNDPDALMVRRRAQPYRHETLSLGSLNDTEALTSALNQYLGGGLVCFTENLTEVEADRLYLLRHCSPSLGVAAVPRDGLDGGRFPAIFSTQVQPRAAGLPPWCTLSLVNWHDQPRSFHLDLDQRLLGTPPWAGQPLWLAAFAGGWERPVPWGAALDIGPVPPHGCEVIKVMATAPDQPLLLRTNGHFSMGGVEVSAWEPTAAGLRCRFDWPWPVPLHLCLRPPVGRRFAAAGAPLGPAGLACLHLPGPIVGITLTLPYVS